MSIETKKQTKEKISEDLAIKEFHEFLKTWQRKPCKIDEVEDNYSASIDALMKGELIFNENKEPIYNLVKPVNLGTGDITQVVFKTRIKPSVKGNLSEGLNLSKSQGKMSLRLIAHIAGVPTVADLDLFEKFDYEVIGEIAPVFM